jgi:beta-N-acetylhexosaminidase
MLRSSLSTLLILCTLFLLLPIPTSAQSDPVAAALAGMTVEERVGQIFIVPFVGPDVGDNSNIAELIVEYKVGGVVLLAANQNFTNDDTTPRQVGLLASQLQGLALGHARSDIPLPLFVAIDHEGDGWPYTRITGGVTPLPSPMAIGATWDPTSAEAIGQVVGRELSAMGINLLLGPSVDVLNDPRPTGRGDIGVRAFGGDPDWVGTMGRAYIRGVHLGSNGRVATVAKHFPGHGGSDRLPDDEIATVDKSLSELRRIELAPFFQITDLTNGDDGAGVTDALMSSHIRYRGFQGNIRQFTAPISFDPEGMATMLGLSEFIPWQDQGGLIVSDALGVPAVRKYFDPMLSSYPHRRIAKESFLAGNDLLILAQFDLNNYWPDQFENIKDTILFFRAEYRSNPAFAARVDQAVSRVLRLKLKLYPDPTQGSVLVDPELAMQVAGGGRDIVSNIARRALTQIYPDAHTPAGQISGLPAPPRPDESLLIISDVRQVRDCYDCPFYSVLPVDVVQETILRLYGPDGTGQVAPERISSLTFTQLKSLLTGPLNAPPEALSPPAEATDEDYLPPEEVLARIQAADWIVFASLDLNTARYPESDALKLFLAQGGPVLFDKRVVVLSLNAPYYLDTTEISKLDAYYCVYGKTEPFVETVVRALFGEVTASGASPVNVEGVGYDLAIQLSPDPDQPMPVSLLEELPKDPLPPVGVHVGVGPVLDQNGHPVPDGTEVTFVASYRGEGGSVALVSAATLGGMAEASFTLPDPGQTDIVAQSGEASSQHPLLVTVAAPPTATPTTTPTSTPTAIPTSTATPLPSATPSATPSPSATHAPTPTPTSVPTSEPIGDVEEGGKSGVLRPVDGFDLLAALSATVLAGVIGFSIRRRPGRTASRRVQLGLLVFIGGLVGYLLYGMGWLRPEMWLVGEVGSRLIAGRLSVAALAFLLGLASLMLERSSDGGQEIIRRRQ